MSSKCNTNNDLTSPKTIKETSASQIKETVNSSKTILKKNYSKTNSLRKSVTNVDSKQTASNNKVDDVCDCCNSDCPGCFFLPCESCGSHKCGHQCRFNREWKAYDKWEWPEQKLKKQKKK